MTAASIAITCACENEYTCAIIEGGEPPHSALRFSISDPNGKKINNPLGRQFPFGSRIKYSCEEGLVVTGDEYRLCTDKGWSGRRASCEEGSPGLSNFHVAVIASAASAFIIIVISIAFIICCCLDRKKKKLKQQQQQQNHSRRTRAARDNNAFAMNLAGSDDFLYGNTVDRRSNGFAGRHNDIRKYQKRPYLLPGPGAPRVPTGSPRVDRPISRPRSYLDGNSSSQPDQRPALRAVTHQLPGSPALTRSPQSPAQAPRTSSQSKIAHPPPGYMEPPPSYETMVREGYIDPNGKRRNKWSS